MTTGPVEISSRQVRRWGRRMFDTLFCSCDPALMPFGKENIWHIRPAGLGPLSVVVSAGVGHDISFEKELIDYAGCSVLLLDPSPTGAATMAKPENQRPQIEYLRVGLAGRDGEKRFNAPRNAAEGSFWSAPGQKVDGEGHRFACRSLSSLAAERGFSRIDLLKMDIEGAEYEVIEDLVHSGLQVDQLCLEFHHFMPEVPISRTLHALRSLYGTGLRLAHKSGSDYTLLRA